MASKLSLFLAELKRRKVYRVAVVYVVVGAGIIGLADAALPSDVWDRLQVPIVVLVLVGLPIALVLAWAYEVKPEEPRPPEPSEKETATRSQPAVPTAGTATEQRKSIVVLPFDNLSPDSDNEYFSDGVTEDIITRLSGISALKVISRTSAMRYKGSDKSLKEIAGELGVTNVLEGSVRHAGGRIRVAAQLIDAETDHHLWAETFDRELDDVFAIQGEVAERIAEALDARLATVERMRATQRPTENVEAYERFVLGRYHWFRFTEDGVRLADEYFRQALELDPNFAEAHWGMASVVLMTGGAPLHLLPSSVAVPQARRSIERALELDPGLGEGYEVLALLQCWFDLDWEGASRTAIRGTETSPNSSATWAARAQVHNVCGLHEDAMRSIQRALDLDPLSGLMLQIATWVYGHARDYPSAERYGRRLLEVHPGFPIGVFTLGEVLLSQGRSREALDLVEPHAVTMESFSWGKAILANALGRTGRAEEAIRHAEQLITLCREGRATWSDVAVAYLGAGRRDLALRYLEEAPGQRPPGGFTTAYLGVLPILDELRSDPRFGKVLQQIGWRRGIGGK